MTAPALHLVLAIEESPVVEVHSFSAADEARLLEDFVARRGDLGREILDALDGALEQLEARTARLLASDVGRRAA